MLPLTDFFRPKRFPVVTIALAIANLLVWLAYELPRGLERSALNLGFRPCEVTGACHDTQLAWPLQVATSMFTHGGWSHIVGNLVFLLVFGPRIEELLGRGRFLLTYVAAGVVADALQGGLTLAFAAPADARVTNIGASGAISGVLGAYAIAYAFERVLTWVIPVFFLRMPALGFLGVWFLLQAAEGSYALSNPAAVVSVAFFAHVGGFLMGAAAVLLTRSGGLSAPRAGPRERPIAG
jgi:membrane associated rhomboid family serine protease